MKILIAEDERITRCKLQTQLEKLEHEVIAVENGAEAWAIIENEDIPIVITDWEMPEMNGLKLIEKIRGQPKSTRYVYIIILTGRSDTDDIVKGMEAGADDFISKPFDKNELRVRLRAGMRVTSLERDLAARNREISEANARMRSDLDVAAKLQQSLLPTGLPADFPLQAAWAYFPSEELAGDTLNVFSLDEENVAVYVVDVSGHGLPAALLSVTISRLMNVVHDKSPLFNNDQTLAAPATVASNLNRQFPMDKMEQRYFTLAYGILNTKTLEFNYISAGHPPLIRISADGESELLTSENFAIGWFPDADYHEQSIQLEQGDRLYLYSDGITEAMNPAAEQYGYDRMLDSLTASRHASLADSVQGLSEHVSQWVVTDHFKDDVSILGLEIK